MSEIEIKVSEMHAISAFNIERYAQSKKRKKIKEEKKAMYKKLYEHPSMVEYLPKFYDVIVMSGLGGFDSDEKDNWTNRGSDIL